MLFCGFMEVMSLSMDLKYSWTLNCKEGERRTPQRGKSSEKKSLVERMGVRGDNGETGRMKQRICGQSGTQVWHFSYFLPLKLVRSCRWGA